jgi:hypothetical protein
VAKALWARVRSESGSGRRRPSEHVRDHRCGVPRIDSQIVDQAPWLPLVNPKVVDVLSKRVGNYQYNPSGVLIDQLWVR